MQIDKLFAYIPTNVVVYPVACMSAAREEPETDMLSERQAVREPTKDAGCYFSSSEHLAW